MKRTFILLMSAAALIVILAALAYGWGASTATTWDGYGWQAHNSSNVQATSTSAYCRVEAPSTVVVCNRRYAKVYKSSNNAFVTQAYCTTPYECCAVVEWTAEVGTSYYVQATQYRFDAQACGPTTAKISSSMLSCTSEGPDGE